MLESGVISWVSRLEKTIALSTMEADYVSTIEACKEMILSNNFMKELGKEQVYPSLHSDSQSAINFTNNPVHHDNQAY